MRRVALVIGCFLLMLVAAPQAQAQFSPRGLLNIITSPLRGFGRIVRPRSYAHRHHGPRRSVARRAAPAATASKPTMPAAAVVAGVAGAATVPAAPANADVKPDDAAKPEDVKPEVSKTATGTPAAAPAAFWPAAHEDLIGYVFWPGEYDDRIWGHGFADITSAVLAPRPGRAAATSSAASSVVAGDAAKVCRPDTDTDWPSGRITKMLTDSVGETSLTEQQRSALKSLETAIADAMKSVRSACVEIVNAEPSARMQTMLDRLWSIRVAGYLVREPLEKFWNTLTPAQRAKFERGTAPDDTFGLCSASSAQALPFPQLERTIRPNAAQRIAFGNLQRRFEQAALSLRASCPGKPPATPMARLDAALDRIDAITYAAGNLAPAFGEFYASLNDDQRSRLTQFVAR